MTMLFERPAARDVILRDGRTLRLRAPDGEDRPAILAFFEAMSARSRYLRFHGFPALDDRLADRFVDVDWNETGSRRRRARGPDRRVRELGAAARAADGGGRLRGRGRVCRAAASARACSSSSPALAGEAGIEQLRRRGACPRTGRCSPSSPTRASTTARELAGGEIEVALPITPTEHYQARVDERDHVAVRASLQPFFRPRTRRGRRRLAAPQVDRRRALPQRPSTPSSPAPRIP